MQLNRCVVADGYGLLDPLDATSASDESRSILASAEQTPACSTGTANDMSIKYVRKSALGDIDCLQRGPTRRQPFYTNANTP